ncbi:MAG: ABC transporter substrate-binding protein, partial [Myxococcota bacterium]
LAMLLLCLTGCPDRSTAELPAGSGAAPSPGVTQTTIKIGSWGPITGPAASWGVVLKSMEAYFHYINDRGGIHGRKIQLIYRDDQYDPKKTVAIARELVEKEEVFAIVGGIGTATGRAVADYLETKGVPFFSPASGDRFWTDPPRKNVYTTYPRYMTEGQILGEYIAKELRSLKVAVLLQDDDFGTQGAEGLQRGLEKFGGKLQLKVTCKPTDTDLSEQVKEIVSAAPEVLVLFAAPKQAVTVVKMLEAQKKKPHILTSFVLSDPMVFDAAGKKTWEGTITSVSLELPNSDDESVKKYRQVLSKYGGGKLQPGTFSQAGFALAMPFVEALERAGNDLTREKLYEALNSMKGYDGGGPYWTSKGMGPPITFGPDDRLGNDRLFLAKAVDGQWTKVSDWLELAEAKPERKGGR